MQSQLLVVVLYVFMAVVLIVSAGVGGGADADAGASAVNNIVIISPLLSLTFYDKFESKQQ